MFRFVSFLWVCLWSFILDFFASMVKHCLHRLKVGGDDRLGNDANFCGVHSQKDDKVVNRYGDEAGESVLMNSSCENKYQFLSSRDVSGFVEGPKVFSFTVDQIFVGSNQQGWMSSAEFLNKNAVRAPSSDHRFRTPNSEVGSRIDEVDDPKSDNKQEMKTLGSSLEEFERPNREIEYPVDGSESLKPSAEVNDHKLDKKQEMRTLGPSQEEFEMPNREIEYPVDGSESLKPSSEVNDHTLDEKQEMSTPGSSQKEFAMPSSETGFVDHVSGSFSQFPGVVDHNEEAIRRAVLHKEFEISNSANQLVDQSSEVDNRKLDLCASEDEEGFLEHKMVTDDDDYIEFEPHLISPHDLQEEQALYSDVVCIPESQDQREMDSNPWAEADYDDDETDILQEHRDLVQQMKMEMRHSKAKGLPTISEEEECLTPKTMEDLQPLDIDVKFEYKDRLEEIQKFYRSYAERMRKLDIMNYQTLHAISFIQLKDSEEGQKPSISVNKPFFPGFRPNKPRRIHVDSTNKSASEAQRDLELVYVGQICLSWEILCWQYAKTEELLDCDPQGCHSYNRVAAECQQFQVLVERFVEDEPFQGPRVQHYTKNRCIVRILLQVPMIRGDCVMEKNARGEDETRDSINIAMLAKIIKESMQVFWEFLITEKTETRTALAAGQGSHRDVRDPELARLLKDIRGSLQQKERRLNRSRNCIVKKFQKGGENIASLICQVELKLVSRVLSLPGITIDQLIWCQRKLNNITFQGRKVQVEPSFCLFPC